MNGGNNVVWEVVMNYFNLVTYFLISFTRLHSQMGKRIYNFNVIVFKNFFLYCLSKPHAASTVYRKELKNKCVSLCGKGEQNMPSQNVSFHHIDYFELKLFKKEPVIRIQWPSFVPLKVRNKSPRWQVLKIWWVISLRLIFWRSLIYIYAIVFLFFLFICFMSI